MMTGSGVVAAAAFYRAALVRFVFSVLVAGLMAGGNAASAATMTNFYLAGNGGLASSYDFNVDGIGLSVTAGSFSGSTITTGAQVGQYSRGLGVTSHANYQHYVDGYTLNDLLIFTFDQQVQFKSVTFSYNDANDDFRFFFDNGNSSLVDWGSNVDIPGTNFYATYVFNNIWLGDVFGIGAYDKYDNFKVKAVSVSAVPLPAALPLFAGALGLIGAARLRQRRKAAA